MMPKLIQKIYRLVTTHPFLYIVTFFSVFLSVSYFCCFFVVAIMYNDFHINVFCHAKYKYVTGTTEWINLLYYIVKIEDFFTFRVKIYNVFSVQGFPYCGHMEGSPCPSQKFTYPPPPPNHQISISVLGEAKNSCNCWGSGGGVSHHRVPGDGLVRLWERNSE